MSWFFAAKNFIGSIPRDVWYVVAAALAVWLIYGHGKDVGYDKRDAEYAEAARKAAVRAREADVGAGNAIDQERGEVEAGNDRAREAAHGSNDPLRDGLNSLRGT